MVVLPVLRSPMISSRSATADRCHRVDRLDAGLQRLTHGLATHDARRLDLHAAQLRAGEFALAVDRLAERVDDASEHAVTDRHRQDASGRLDGLALFDVVDVAEHDGADRSLVEVQRQTHRAVLELEEFVHAAVGEAVHGGDAVAHFGDAADGAGFERRLEAVEVLLQCRCDVGGRNGQLSHGWILYSRLFSWSMRVRTVSSMTVSPTVATIPPTTVGSTVALRLSVLPVAFSERRLQPVELVGGERHGGADLGDVEVLGARGALHEAVDDRRDVAAAAGSDHHRHELHGGGRGLAAEQVLDDRLALLGRQVLVGEGRAQRVARLVRAGEAEQLVLDLVERAFGAGDLEQCPCVAFDACVAHELAPVLAPTRWMNPSMSAWWVASSSVSWTMRSIATPEWRAISERSSSLERPAAAGDVGIGASLELGHLGLDADPAVGDQRLGLGVGLGVQAGALGIDVALGPADV